APVTDFTADKTSSCDGTIKFTDKSSSSPTSWAWDFGDGGTSTQQNPTHTYTTAGTFTVKLKATNQYGNDDEIKTSYITVNLMTPPTGKDAERCGPGTLKLTASGSNNLNWYTTQTGGTPVYTGTDYSANVTATTTYYVESSSGGAIQKVGPTDNSLAGGLFTANSEHGLKFDVLAACVIKSVKVYAGAEGDRTIDVLDNTGAVVKTKVVTIPAGESRVALDFDLQPGTQYFIKVSSTLVDLFRASGNATYPYTAAGLVSITETDVQSSNPGYYYYFYDWEVQAAGCSSARIAVVATVNPEVAKPTITEANKVLSGPAGSGLTYQWYMNGNQIPGATNQTYTPTGNGNYTVQVSNGKCSATSDIFSFTLGINSLDFDKVVRIYPNPAKEAIFIDAAINLNKEITVQIYSVIGKLVYTETYSNNGQVHQVNLGSIPADGIYFLKLQCGSEQLIRKVTLTK
ncbi:MAG TPA: PKD domain-containing protein, partial [Bacteroidia bacterium]|nr:PKD domain-containing protein [Bacteroidia bacterium]